MRLMRFRCKYCGRFIKVDMKSPTFDGSDHNATVTGWTGSGMCKKCYKHTVAYMDMIP